MITRTPSLELLRHDLRVAVCPCCFRRRQRSGPSDVTTGERCESTCPVFTELPHLKEVAERLDPMIKPIAEQLRNEIIERCRKRGGKASVQRSPLRRYAGRISREIGQHYN